jgi:hypothetical protein
VVLQHVDEALKMGEVLAQGLGVDVLQNLE